MRTLLFFDDLQLHSRNNVTRRVGKPQLIKESVYRDPHVSVAWGCPSVFRHEQSGKWRMLYQGWSEGEPRAPLIAESDEGLSWQPLDTTRSIDIPDRIWPHQVLSTKNFHGWGSCYADSRAEPDERLKGLAYYIPEKWHLGSRLWVSPDGLRWRLKEEAKWQKKTPDFGASVFWNEVRQSYVFTTRPDNGDRRIAVFETKDWESFTEPELALQADALDSPLAEMYGMPVVAYQGYYIGFLWLYHVAPQIEGHYHKFYDGHVDCQLAYSLNGWHFQRALRDAFIPNGAPNEPDSGCVYPTCMVEQEDGSLWIYASASTQEHGHLSPGCGSIVTYRLRRDGFVYLESCGGRGTIGTRMLYWKGGDVELNIQSQNGAARVQVTDVKSVPVPGYTFAECQPFSGDDAAWRPVWQEQRTLGGLEGGRALRIEVELNNARLYALRGDFVPMIGPWSLLSFEQGEAPQQPSPGF